MHLEELMRHIGRWGGPGAEGAVAKALRLGAGAGHGREGKSSRRFLGCFHERWKGAEPVLYHLTPVLDLVCSAGSAHPINIFDLQWTI